MPRRIISVRQVQFWNDFVCLIGSSQGLSSAFHPSTNGASERANAMVECYPRRYISYQQTDWPGLLSFAEVAYNNTVHSGTGFTSFWVLHEVEFVPILEWTQGAQEPRKNGQKRYQTPGEL